MAAAHDTGRHAHHQHEKQADHTGHGDHHDRHDHGDHAAVFRRLFLIMLVLGVPTVLFSPMFGDLLGYEVSGAGLWVSPILGNVMYFWGGQPFLEGAWDEIKQRRPGMMLLVALAITVAFLSSWAATLGWINPELEYWWELALLIVIMLLGHWIEMRSLSQTSSALDSLAALLPDEAERVVGDDVEKISPAELRLGDVVIVRPGASLPADGHVIQGSASMDESMITGESATVRRREGDAVVAGTVATDSGLRVEVTALGEDTTLAGISKLVDDAQNSSSRAQRLADRASGWLFWYALAAAAVTAAVWMLIGTPEQVVARVITVLVIACPHALGLAIPLVVSTSTERAAQAGVLVTDRMALESMRGVDTVIFDKTGTLTKGAPAVNGVESVDMSDDALLAVAAAAESDSEHPLATAIVGAARDRGLTVPPATDFSSSPAVGVEARVDGRLVQVGGPYLLEQENQRELEVAEKWRPRRHDHRRRRSSGGLSLRRTRHRRLFRRRTSRGQIRRGAFPAGTGPAGGHGRGRRQRRPRPRPGGRGRGDRCGHRRGHRLRRSRPRLRRPAGGALRVCAVAGRLPQDGAEPLVGRRLQPPGRAPGRRRARPLRVHSADVRRRRPDVAVHDHRGAQRPDPAPAGPQAGGRDHRRIAETNFPLFRSGAVPAA